MVVPRLDTGLSDPVSYECTCGADRGGGGTVLLFYRYFANSPPLPLGVPDAGKVEELGAWYGDITGRLNITGKIRVASEGFNVTVGGTKAAIESFIASALKHWSFAGLSLSTKPEQKAFFKPSPGCACVFAPATAASIRIASEITPLGITNYKPTSWSSVEELPPPEFHRRCHQEQVTLLDLRNHYESRIGYFVSPQTQEPALKPQIRRFSQWPKYYKQHADQMSPPASQLLSYCTGGIRCEKATRWMAERSDPSTRICTLKGGIAAYLDWVNDEVAAGRMCPEESLFKGRNYVFDARGATGLATPTAPVSQCHSCGVPSDHLGKCHSPGCHLVLVVCAACEGDDVRCCGSCREGAEAEKGETVGVGALGTDSVGHEGVGKGKGKGRSRAICECERLREEDLWRLSS